MKKIISFLISGLAISATTLCYAETTVVHTSRYVAPAVVVHSGPVIVKPATVVVTRPTHVTVVKPAPVVVVR